MVVADINGVGADRVAAGIAAEGGTALAVAVDVSEPDSARGMAERTMAEFGGIDYLVNNAAIFGGMKLDMLLTVDWDYYKKFASVNLDGALLCTRAVAKQMAEGGVAPSSTSPRQQRGSTPITTGLPRPVSTVSPNSFRANSAGRTSASTLSRQVRSTPRPTELRHHRG